MILVLTVTLILLMVGVLSLDQDLTRIKGPDEPHIVSHTILQGVIEPFESSKKAEIPAWKQMKDAADYKAARLFLSQALTSYSQLLRHPYMFGDMPIEERYDVFVSMAKILKRMGFQQRAELLLYEAMSYTTTPREAHYQLSLLALDKEDLQEAKMHMKNCLFHKSDDILLLTHLSMVLIAEGKLYEAKFYLSQLLSALEVKTKELLRASDRKVEEIVDLTARVDQSSLARWLEDMMVRVIHGELQITTSTSLQLVRMLSNLYTLIGDGELTGRLVFDIGQSLYEGGRPKIGHMMMSRGHSTSNAVVEGVVSYEVVKLRLQMDYPVVPASTRAVVELYFNITLFLSGATDTSNSNNTSTSTSTSGGTVDIENVMDLYWPLPLLGWTGLPSVPLIRELLWRFGGVPRRQDAFGAHFLAMASASGTSSPPHHDFPDAGVVSDRGHGQEEEEEEEEAAGPYNPDRFPLAAAMHRAYFDMHSTEADSWGDMAIHIEGDGGFEDEEDEEDEEVAAYVREQRDKLGDDYSDGVQVYTEDGQGVGVSSHLPVAEAVPPSQPRPGSGSGSGSAPGGEGTRRRRRGGLAEVDRLMAEYTGRGAADPGGKLGQGNPIEVGIFSGHVNAHPVGQTILARVLGAVGNRPTFDARSFRVTLLALLLTPDHITKRVASGVHRVVNLPLDKARAWRVVEALQLDVLLVPDWAPFPDAQAFFLGSSRMAPVQACFYVRGGGSACPFPAMDYYLVPEELQEAYLAQVPAASPSNAEKRPGWLEAHTQQVVLVDWPLLPVATILELAGAAATAGGNNVQNNHTSSAAGSGSSGSGSSGGSGTPGSPSPGTSGSAFAGAGSGGGGGTSTNLGFVPLEIEGQVFYEDQPVAVLPLHPSQVHPLMDEVIFKIMQSTPNLHLILVLPRVYFPSGNGSPAGEGEGEDEAKISWARILVRRLWKGGGGLYHRIRLLPSPLNDRRLVQLLRQADMVLDSFPVGNFLHFHALALSVGTPVVTLRPGTQLATSQLDLGEIKAMLRSMHARAASDPSNHPPGMASSIAAHPLYQRLLNSSVGRTRAAIPWVATESAVAGFYQRCQDQQGGAKLASALVASSLSEYFTISSTLAADRELAYQVRVDILDAVDREGRQGYGVAQIHGLWDFLRRIGEPWAALRAEFYRQTGARGDGTSSSSSSSSRTSVRRRGRSGASESGTGMRGEARESAGSHASGRRRRKRRGKSSSFSKDYDFDEGAILTE